MAKPPVIPKPMGREVVPIFKRLPPPGRATMVASLLKNPETAAIIRALPNPKNVPCEQLGTTSLAGNPVKAAVSLGHLTPVCDSVDDFDWESGIHFTPKTPGPTYSYQGRTYNAGSFLIENIYLPHEDTLTHFVADDFLYVRGNRTTMMDLHVELPSAISTYLIAVEITLQPQQVDMFGLAERDQRNVGDWAGANPVPHTLLADNTGIVGLYTIRPYTPQKPGEGTMRATSCTLYLNALQNTGLHQFRGFVITRL